MRQVTGAAGIALALMAQAAAAQDATVVAVNYPLQYFAERLAGEAAEVLFPVPADVDPSFWRPAIADITTVQAADLILLNGAGFATWIDRVSLPRSRLVNTTRDVEDQFIVTESITHSHGDGGEHSHEGLASYTWLDPMLAAAQAAAVADALSAKGIVPAADVAASLDILQADLAALGAEAAGLLAGAQDVAMIATHPRYDYLARHYDLTIDALEWEAGAAPDADDLAALEAMIAETGAQVLVWEAAPAAEAFDATAALGVANVVFPPLAHGVDGRSFGEAYLDGVSALADAVTAVTQ